MKKSFLKNVTKALFFGLISITIFASCKKDDDDNTTPTNIVLDGYYVKGAATALTKLDSKGMMKVTKNEVLQKNRSTLLELYVAVKAGNDGFNIVKVSGATQTTYGPGTDFADVTDLSTDEPTGATFKRGSLIETTNQFTVPKDGLYHVVIETELNKVVVAPVHWGVIGAATPGSWSSSTELASTGFDLNSITFQAKNVTMLKGQFKYRYSDGWKIVIDSTIDLGGGKKGVKVNTNLGGTLDALEAGADNIQNDIRGFCTLTLKWTLGKTYEATVVKTGDIAATDYTNIDLGFIGNGIIVADTSLGWDYDTYGLRTPNVDSTIYTWKWDSITVVDTGSFKIRQGQDWDHINWGYSDFKFAGSAASKFEDASGNIKPTENGTYNFTLVIDAAQDVKTLTIEPITK